MKILITSLIAVGFLALSFTVVTLPADELSRATLER